MEIILISVCVCLFVFSLIMTFRFLHIKREIRRFSSEAEKLKNKEYAQPLKLTCFDRDITELAVKINEHMDIRHNLSIEYEHEKNRLNNIISGISHDFRTPLTASLGYLQMLKKSGEISEKNSEYLNIAIQKNEYLKELSDEFFELTKLENDNEEITTEKINLSNILSDCIMEQYGWIQERGITPEFEITDGIVIESNHRHIMRILGNLLSNAEKYASCRFGVTLVKRDNDICLSVYNDIEDNNSVDVDKVFEPFYRAYSRNKKGSGLGLYVVKCLSEKLGLLSKAFLDENGMFTIEIIFKNQNPVE